MKRIIPQVGGHNFRLDDLVIMQQGYTESIAGIISALSPNGNCILSGVVETSERTLPDRTYQYTLGYVAFKPYGQEMEVFKFNNPTSISSTGIVIDGLSQVTIGDPGTLRYLKIVEEIITPSSPVPYEDTLNKNVHFLRTMTMKYYDSSVDHPGIDGMIFANPNNGSYNIGINYANTSQRGFIQEFYPFPIGEENNLFDSNGLGLYRMKGLAICNGKSHIIPGLPMPFVTPDLRGKFKVMPSTIIGSTLSDVVAPAVTSARFDYATGIWDPLNYLTPGAIIGLSSYSILQNNIPNYNLNVTENNHIHALPNLTHSHAVIARKVGYSSNPDHDFFAVALGDSTHANGRYSTVPGHPTRSELSPAGSDADHEAGSSYDRSGGGAGSVSKYAGSTREIQGEINSSASYDISPGLYTPDSESVENDDPNGGFVRLWDGSGLHTISTTVVDNTVVNSAGTGTSVINVPPAYAMISLVRLW